MTVQNPPLWIDGGSYTPELDRTLLRAVFSKAGPVGLLDFKVHQTTVAGLSLEVDGGLLVIDGTTGTYQGRYLVENRGVATIGPLSAGHGTNPRKDRIVARVDETANDWDIEVVEGTPAPVPAEPAIPADAYELAMLDVPALDSTFSDAQITDRRFSYGKGLTAARGGVVTTTSGAFPTSNVVTGTIGYDTTTAKFYYYNGIGWFELPGTPTSWATPALVNSWANFGGAFATAAYRKVGDVVEMRGLVTGGTVTAGTVITTLPTGFRPPADLVLATAGYTGGGGMDAVRIDVGANGQVKTGVTYPGSNYLSLNGVRFSTI